MKKVGGRGEVFAGFVDIKFLALVADMTGRCRAYHTSLHSTRIVSCTSLNFLLRGFRRKVVGILVKRSIWVHHEAFLKLRHFVRSKCCRIAARFSIISSYTTG